MGTQKCDACGKCCHFEIPITILDIHRIAVNLEITDEAAFEKLVQPDTSRKSGLFKIKKREDKACIFLNDKNLCSINEFKPRTCEFYFCKEPNNKAIPWTSNCISQDQKTLLWEEAIAAQVTKKYIHKNSVSFNEADFSSSLLSIYDNIVNNKSDKLKLAKTPDNNHVGLKYNCETCKSKGECAEETIITLLDIDRIVKEKNLSFKEFFKNYIDKELSKNSGIYKLIRTSSCIFFNSETHCLISDYQPYHCRFTPCPQKVKDKSIYDCFYLGAGNVEEQFEHQVAISITKEYINKNGLKCNESDINNSLKRIRKIVLDRDGFKNFCNQIAKFRYIDDTRAFL